MLSASEDSDGFICEVVDSDDEEVANATANVTGGNVLVPRCSISQFIRRIAFTIYHAAFFLERRQVCIQFPSVYRFRYLSICV